MKLNALVIAGITRKKALSSLRVYSEASDVENAKHSRIHYNKI